MYKRQHTHTHTHTHTHRGLARLTNENRFSDLIECDRGVKQGDVCRPVLFSLFTNELALEIILGKHGAIVSPELIESFTLLFADNLLISEAPIGLQNQLKSLEIN